MGNSEGATRAILGRVRGSGFIKSVLVVMTGTAAAQVVGFAISPVLSRLFTPSDFGVLGSFTAVVGVIVAGVTLDFAQAMMLPKSDQDGMNVFALSCASTVLITLLCGVACLVVPGRIRGLIKAPSFAFVALLPLAVLVGGLQSSLQSWATRTKAFKWLSGSQIARSLSSNGSQIALGLLCAGSLGITGATVFGDILATLVLLRVFMPDLSLNRQHLNWQKMKDLFGEYRHFPMYSAPREVMNALSRGLPVLLLTNYFGLAVAGAYAFGVRVLSVPINFVQNALRPVLFQRASEVRNLGGNVVPLYLRTTGGLLLLVSLPAVVTMIWAPPIFEWVFGSQWDNAGAFARWLVLWLAFFLGGLPSTVFAQVARMQRQAFFFDIAMLLTRALSLVLGGMYLSAMNTVIAYSVVSCGMNIVWIAMVGVALLRQDRNAEK